MTKQERMAMQAELSERCNSSECEQCPLFFFDYAVCDNGFIGLSDGELEGAYNKMFSIEQEERKEQTANDIINHPEHYTNKGMECIDEMKLVFGIEAVMHFCLCNVWKYRYRADTKEAEESMKKADWYMKKYAELKKEMSW